MTARQRVWHERVWAHSAEIYEKAEHELHDKPIGYTARVVCYAAMQFKLHRSSLICDDALRLRIMKEPQGYTYVDDTVIPRKGRSLPKPRRLFPPQIEYLNSESSHASRR